LKDFNATLRSDEDFERASADVATLKGAEEALESARVAILESAGDINATLTSMADLRGEIASKRLAISRQIDAEKTKVRAGMLAGALAGIQCATHLRPRYTGKLEAAMKGKRSIENISSALRAEVETINSGIIECQAALDTFESRNGRAMTADRDTLELMDPGTLAGELARRKDRSDHEVEKRRLEAEANAARKAAAAMQAQREWHEETNKKAEQAAQAAAVAQQPAPAAQTPPATQKTPLQQAQALAANPHAPRMIDPEPEPGKPAMDESAEWGAFRSVFFASLAPVKVARGQLTHPANIQRGDALAVLVSDAWRQVTWTEGGPKQ